MVGLRISVAGRVAAILEAMLPLLADHPVRSLHLEWDGDGELLLLLTHLHSLGFVEAQHRGPNCAARWSQDVRDGVAKSSYIPNADLRHLDRSCRLVSNAFNQVDAERLQQGAVEVFLLRRPPSLLPL